MPQTIFINGRFLTKPVTGVQRYARELVRALDQLLDARKPGVEFVCLAPPEEFGLPAWRNIRVDRLGHWRGNLWEQIDLPRLAAGRLLFSPANIGPWKYDNQVVTLHDAAVYAAPQSYSPAFRAKYAFVWKQLTRRARQLLTVSEFSRAELGRYLEIPPERFTVLRPGSDHLEGVPSDPSILAQYKLERESYFLVVSSRGAHKNLGRLSRALRAVRSNVKIVLVGAPVFHGLSEKPMDFPASRVRSVGYVNDGELKALYQNALGLIFPSTYEGFGLPVLEAMQTGCPVVCSNAASLPEVAGEAALFFDPYDTNDMAGVIDRFLSQPELRRQLQKKGYLRAREFKWSASARQLLEMLILLA